MIEKHGEYLAELLGSIVDDAVSLNAYLAANSTTLRSPDAYEGVTIIWCPRGQLLRHFSISKEAYQEHGNINTLRVWKRAVDHNTAASRLKDEMAAYLHMRMDERNRQKSLF